MKILECPECGTLHPVDQKASCVLCTCHNPYTFVSAEKHCVGVLRRGKVRQALKLAKDLKMDLSKLLMDLLELKQL